MPAPKPTVGLFVTCLADAMRPNVAFAAVHLLEAAGAEVHVPEAQTCCGQPAYNSGASDAARAIAKQVIESFLPFDYVVAPSGSCAGMIKAHYADLFSDSPDWALKQEELAAKTFELTQFLHTVMQWRPEGVSLPGTATYHDSCSGLRELGVKAEPRALLAEVQSLQMAPLVSEEACCGFGGSFCLKYPEISTAIVADKAKAVGDTGADFLLAGDLGCLMNMAGKLSRDGSKVRCFHVAEVLAGMAEGDGI
ncbi:MAG: (Fe-S)-binding protein [Alphaproteobacteria bacterium]